MVGTIVSEFGDTEELIASVHTELVALRGAHGRLTVEKFSQYPALLLVCGGGDLLEAFLMFEREMRRYMAEGNRNEAAAAISITAPADTVLARLEYVVTDLENDGEFRDQRTGRRWSDRGLKTIATEMVHVAEVRGRLGSELLTIEITGNREEGLHLTISQLTNKNLDERAPLVRFWKHQGDDLVEQPEGLTLDFDRYKRSGSRQRHLSPQAVPHHRGAPRGPGGGGCGYRGCGLQHLAGGTGCADAHGDVCGPQRSGRCARAPVHDLPDVGDGGDRQAIVLVLRRT